MTIIRLREITKDYRNKRALDIPYMDIEEGELVGIVGNNGAGKTTLFRSILDLVKPDTGNIWIQDDLVHNSENWKTILHSYIDESFLIEFLKPKEYFHFIGKTLNLDNKAVMRQVNEFPELLNEDISASTKLIRELSTGSKVRVGLIAAFLGNPKILLLDEPFAHLDPSSQVKLGRSLKKLNEQGVTVVLSSHNLQNVAQLCSRIILIEGGQIIKDEISTESVLESVNAYFEAE